MSVFVGVSVSVLWGRFVEVYVGVHGGGGGSLVRVYNFWDGKDGEEYAYTIYFILLFVI